MHQLSQPVLTTKDIQQIVISVLENKGKDNKTDNNGKQICTLLLAKKKICPSSRMEKMKKEMKIFQKLQSYIDFQEVYNTIKAQISQRFYEYKKKQELKKKKFDADEQLLFEKQFAELTKSDFSEAINQLNTKIEIQYREKHERFLSQQAKHISDFIDDIERKKETNKYSIAPYNRNAFQMSYLLKVDQQNQFKDYFQNFPLEERKHKYRSWNYRQRDVKIYFTYSDKQQLAVFYRQALALLALAIENYRKRARFNLTRLKDDKVVSNFTTKKISILQENKISKSLNQGCSVIYQDGKTIIKNTSLSKSHPKSANINGRSFSASLHKPIRNPKKHISFALIEEDMSCGVGVVSSSSIQKIKPASKTVSFQRVVKNQSVSVSVSVSESVGETTATKKYKQNAISQKLDSRTKKKSLKKINYNQYFQNKVNKIVGQIEKEQTFNRFKRCTFNNFISYAQDQYCADKPKNQIHGIIKEAQSQIIERRWADTHHSTKKLKI